MHTDPRSQAQALEFLFLFHACKLTNNRPDQSVSLADVARVAGLNQDQSEQLCASLREARLIRYSSLLGDISVTRFGVSEVVTTKACPHSGANYFPAVRQMGLRFSRGHHLFDDLELSRLSSKPDADQMESFTKPPDPRKSGGFTNTGHMARSTDATYALSESATANAAPTQWANDQAKTSGQIRQEIIRELELLLDQLDGKAELPPPQQPSAQNRSPRYPTRPTRPSIKPEKPRIREHATNGPSLLFNPQWTPGDKRQVGSATQDSKAETTFSSKPGLTVEESASGVNRFAAVSIDVSGQDVTTSVEKLYELMHGWCQTAASKNSRSNQTSSFLFDLEKINESLFSFS